MNLDITRLDDTPPWTVWTVNTGTSNYPADVLYPTITHPPGHTIPVPNNALVLHHDEHLVLLDTGLPADDDTTDPPIHAALNLLGFNADTVTAVVISHLHPDHLGALISPGRAALFPNATHYIHRNEWTYFSNEANLRRHAGRVAYAARTALAALTTTTLVLLDQPTTAVLPGVQVVLAPGHTPGHTVARIGAPPTLVYIADLVAHEKQLRQSDLPSGFDRDNRQALNTRVAMLTSAEVAGSRLIGAHLPTGIGR